MNHSFSLNSLTFWTPALSFNMPQRLSVAESRIFYPQIRSCGGLKPPISLQNSVWAEVAVGRRKMMSAAKKRGEEKEARKNSAKKIEKTLEESFNQMISSFLFIRVSRFLASNDEISRGNQRNRLQFLLGLSVGQVLVQQLVDQNWGRNVVCEKNVHQVSQKGLVVSLVQSD
jgi:hypothetical protein